MTGQSHPLTRIAWAKTRLAYHAIASVRNESKLKVAVVSVAAVGLWMGAFVGFYYGFRWLKTFDVARGLGHVGLGDILMIHLLSTFSFILFLMLIFSNILIVFSTLFRSREVAFLLVAPLSFRELFLARFVECAVFSSWASAYLGSPLILAYGLTTEALWPFYIAAAAFYVPFVVIPAALGAFCTLFLVRIRSWVPGTTLVISAAIALAVVFTVLRVKLAESGLEQEGLFSAEGISTVLAITGRAQSPWLPSHWASQGLLLVSSAHYREAAFFFLLLLANAFFLTWFGAEAAQRLFLPGWTDLHGTGRERERLPGRGLPGLIDRFLTPLPEPARSLVAKDIRLFWRDPTQWAQFAVFFGVMAVYVATMRSRMVIDSENYRDWVATMNIAASTLILATLTSRFVFPLVSLEGRRFWILGLAPITLRQVVWQKFFLSVATTSLFTIGLVVLSCLRLRVPPVAFSLALYGIIITNFALSGLAVGLGSLYPNFQEDNPARIVSGMGGTLNFLLSMGYIALVVAAQALVIQWRALERFAQPQAYGWVLAGVFVFITALSATCMTLPMRLGLRHLQTMEE